MNQSRIVEGASIVRHVIVDGDDVRTINDGNKCECQLVAATFDEKL